MKDSPDAATPVLGPAARVEVSLDPAPLRKFIAASLILLVCFSLPFYHVVRFALQSQLYSHIILIPFVSLYFAWLRRDQLRPAGVPVSRGWTGLFLTAGLGVLLWAGRLAFTPGQPAAQEDVLALAMYSFGLLLAGFACLFLSRQGLRALVFPLGFLFFLAPFPHFVEIGLETFLQHGSSLVAYALLTLAGMPVFRNGTYFMLPGFSMQVAPECSGIHSTLALFITSVVAGQLLLISPWKRVILALVVVPIALLRNGLRVFTIGELCVRIGPEMIDSYIHRHGGPVFFVLSLVPFSLILYYLLKSERHAGPTAKPATLT